MKPRSAIKTDLFADEHHRKKIDALGDPLVTEEHIACFGWATQEEMHDIADMAIRINDFMCGLFAGIGTADDDMTHLAAGVRQLGTDAADLAGAIVNLAMVPVLAVGTLVSALSDALGDLIHSAELLSRGDFSDARAAATAAYSQDTQDVYGAMMDRMRAGGRASARLLGVDTGEDAEAPEARHDGSAAAGAMLFGTGSVDAPARRSASRGRGGRRGGEGRFGYSVEAANALDAEGKQEELDKLSAQDGERDARTLREALARGADQQREANLREWQRVQQDWLHTLGNLTLTGGVVAQMPVAAEVGSGDERDELGSG